MRRECVLASRRRERCPRCGTQPPGRRAGDLPGLGRTRPRAGSAVSRRRTPPSRPGVRRLQDAAEGVVGDVAVGPQHRAVALDRVLARGVAGDGEVGVAADGVGDVWQSARWQKPARRRPPAGDVRLGPCSSPAPPRPGIEDRDADGDRDTALGVRRAETWRQPSPVRAGPGRRWWPWRSSWWRAVTALGVRAALLRWPSRPGRAWPALSGSLVLLGAGDDVERLGRSGRGDIGEGGFGRRRTHSADLPERATGCPTPHAGVLAVAAGHGGGDDGGDRGGRQRAAADQQATPFATAPRSGCLGQRGPVRSRD